MNLTATREKEKEVFFQFVKENLQKETSTKGLLKILAENPREGITLPVWINYPNAVSRLLANEGEQHNITPAKWIHGYKWKLSTESSNNKHTNIECQISAREKRYELTNALEQTLLKSPCAKFVEELWNETFPNEKIKIDVLVWITHDFLKKYKTLSLAKGVTQKKLFYWTEQQKENTDLNTIQKKYDLHKYEYYIRKRFIKQNNNPALVEWCKQHQDVSYDVEKLLQERQERNALKERTKYSFKQ